MDFSLRATSASERISETWDDWKLEETLILVRNTNLFVMGGESEKWSLSASNLNNFNW